MEKYIMMIVATSFAMSGVILGLILFNKLFSNRYSAKWRYYVWLIVLLGLLIPFRPNIILPFEPVQISGVLANSEYQHINNLDEINSELNYSLLKSSTTVSSGDNTFAKPAMISNKLQKSEVIFVIWLIGVILSLGLYLWRHKQFSEMVKRWGTEIVDCKILSVLKQAQAELGIRRKVYIKKCKLITSPMLAGFMKPVIFLPDKTIHYDELLFILKHELVHYKRKDLWVNLLVVCVKAVHWFNPFAHIMAVAIRNDCEISCDEAVIGGTSLENRRIYGETIIGFIKTKTPVKTELSINLYGGKNTMKKRIISIMDSSRKKAKIALLCAALVLTSTFMSGFVFAVSGLPADNADKALKTVLEKTGGGTVVKCELDYLGNKDAGIKVYEIEIVNGDTKYEIEIGVDDLTIYGYEEKTSNKNLNAVVPVDTDITPEKAVETALARTGGGEAIKWELSSSNGKKVYKIEIARDKLKYSMNVGAADGEITNYKEKTVNSSTVEKTSVSNSPLIKVSIEEAKEIALARTGGGKVEDCELDYERGIWIYEVEVILGRTEYEVEINAETGEIIKFEIDD